MGLIHLCMPRSCTWHVLSTLSLNYWLVIEWLYRADGAPQTLGRGCWREVWVTLEKQLLCSQTQREGDMWLLLGVYEVHNLYGHIWWPYSKAAMKAGIIVTAIIMVTPCFYCKTSNSFQSTFPSIICLWSLEQMYDSLHAICMYLSISICHLPT